jgi:hypothetical protein
MESGLQWVEIQRRLLALFWQPKNFLENISVDLSFKIFFKQMVRN